jgi:hypothetical protein
LRPSATVFNAACRLVSNDTTCQAPFVAPPLSVATGTDILAGDGPEFANGGTPSMHELLFNPSVREHIFN